MMIPLGFLGVIPVKADFELISTTIATGSETSVTFNVSALASTYKHFQVRSLLRTNAASQNASVAYRFNGDAGANYSNHILYGYPSAATSFAAASQTSADMGMTALGNTSTSGVFGSGIVDILDPFSTSKNKTLRSLGGAHNGGTENRIALGSGAWYSTSAVTSITLVVLTGTTLIAGSRVSLYGIKG